MTLRAGEGGDGGGVDEPGDAAPPGEAKRSRPTPAGGLKSPGARDRWLKGERGLLIQPRWIDRFLAHAGERTSAQSKDRPAEEALDSEEPKTVEVRGGRCLFDIDTPVFLIETDTQLVSPSGAAVLRVAASAEYDGDVAYANKAELDADFPRHHVREKDMLDIQQHGKSGRADSKVSYPLYGWVFKNVRPLTKPVFIEWRQGWHVWIRFRLEWGVAAADRPKGPAPRKARKRPAGAECALKATGGPAQKSKSKAMSSTGPACDDGRVAVAAVEREAPGADAADDLAPVALAPVSRKAPGGAGEPEMSASQAVGLLRRVLSRLEDVRGNQRDVLLTAKVHAKLPLLSATWEEMAKAFRKTSDLDDGEEHRGSKWTSEEAWNNVTLTLASDLQIVDSSCGLLRKALHTLALQNKTEKKERAKRAKGKSRKIEDGKKKAGSLKAWQRAVGIARKDLGVTGFVPVKKGSPVHLRAKEILKES